MKVCISSRVRCHRGRYPSPEYALMGRLKLLQCEFPVSISKLLSKDETRTDPPVARRLDIRETRSPFRFSCACPAFTP
jgi:hypothetical protein